MSFSAIIGLCAAVMQIAAYVLYLRVFLKASIRPNAASWLMFAYGTGLLVVAGYGAACDMRHNEHHCRSALLAPGRD
jgi:hypothetical protein